MRWTDESFRQQWKIAWNQSLQNCRKVTTQLREISATMYASVKIQPITKLFIRAFYARNKISVKIQKHQCLMLVPDEISQEVIKGAIVGDRRFTMANDVNDGVSGPISFTRKGCKLVATTRFCSFRTVSAPVQTRAGEKLKNTRGSSSANNRARVIFGG